MRRTFLLLSIVGLIVALPGAAAVADHAAPSLGVLNAPLGSTSNSGGEGAEWELVTSLVSGNPHTDIDFFTQNGITYVSAGTLAIGGNGGGQTIHQLIDADGNVAPKFISHHPSATCITDPSQALGLQHDVEATPKGEAILNTDWNGKADTRDAQLLLDSTDNPGRCHDHGVLGLLGSVPQGGLEIIDITDIENPVEIGLTSHIGEAHTVNVDPKRPHIAYAVTSDFVQIGDNQRENEDPEDSDRFDLDGFEVVDLSSCMDFPADATVEQKRGIDPETGEFLDGEGCRPVVYRYRYPSIDSNVGHTLRDGVYGCHELEVYPNDLLSCGGGESAMLFDMSGAFDDNGTPDDFTDDKPRGTPLPCRVRASTSVDTSTDAPVIDCVVGENEQMLTVPEWLKIGAPSLQGVRFLGSAHHMGRGGPFPATEDIDFNHETELTHSQDFLIATDERGGGVVPPGASCSPGVPNEQGNGGIHAYAVNRLDTALPPRPVDENGDPVPEGEAYDPYARTPDGEKAIYRFAPKVPAPSFCTAHVFQQVPGQNRIFMGWYTQGTVVVDYIEHPDGTFEWKEAGYFIPENANTWVSHVFKVEDNGDGTFTYYGATGDFQVATGTGPGRNAVDVYKVTLPAPPQFEAQEAAPAPQEEQQPAPSGEQSGTTPTTGGGLVLAALALLGAGASFTRRRRDGHV